MLSCVTLPPPAPSVSDIAPFGKLVATLEPPERM